MFGIEVFEVLQQHLSVPLDTVDGRSQIVAQFAFGLLEIAAIKDLHGCIGIQQRIHQPQQVLSGGKDPVQIRTQFPKARLVRLFA